MSDDRLKVGALFAGYGGLEMGVSQVLDAEPEWLAEFEAAPSRILAQRFPGVPNLGDVTKVDWAAVEPIDIITGGSPCQDLSHAGKRAGMKAGTRSGLWASMCDAIDILRPRLVVWENVRGALSAPADSGDLESCEFCMDGDGEPSLRALGRVLGDLAELGYDAAWTSLRAADVGAPHGRFRVFVLAWPADAESSGLEVGREGRSARGAAAEPAHLGHERAGASRDGRSGLADGRRGALSLLPTPTTEPTTGNGHARNLGGEARALLPTPQAMDTAGAMTDRRSTSGYGPALRDLAALLPTPTSTDHKASGASYAATDTHHTGTTLTDATVRQPERFGQYAPAIARWEAVLGRPAPAPTEPTGKGGAHRLSPRFVEWLMGLPDGWVTGESVEAWRARLADRRTGLDARPVGHRGSVDRRRAVVSRNEQLKALGNGVVPQQAAAAVWHLLGVREWALSSCAV